MPDGRRLALGVVAAALISTPAAANDDGLELWLNPSAAFALDDDTEVELDTAQRLRSASDGREDTYFARLWLHQDLSDAATVSAAVERRFNEPGSDETRLLQQLSTRHGLLRTRLRLEQRFVDDRRMGLRLRPRLGVEAPVGQSGRWSAKADAELFLTLRSTSAGGDEGLTGLRTQVGAEYEVSDRLTVSIVYLRQQDFEDDGPGQVGHAPLIGVEWSF
jgi:hypothetical protein